MGGLRRGRRGGHPAFWVLLCALWLNGSALADQTDSRLPELFDRLASAPDLNAASALEQEIWSIWIASDDPVVNELMRDGAALMNRRDYAGAIELFTKIVEQAPQFAEGWNKRATAYYLQEDYAASVGDIERTLRLEPRHFGAISGMGLIFMKREDRDGALAAFERVLKINPHAPGARAYVDHMRSKGKGAI
ncbi:MAG: tetratricopeptide repeat protein [Gammaproteobacteria bacterium]|nr:tetratricopeptide repeat protein [Gammaproteobacteria bacterium]